MDDNRILNKITLRGTIIKARMAAKNRVVYMIATDGDYKNSFYPEVVHIVNSKSEVHRIGECVTAICHARSAKAEEDGKTVYYKQIIVDMIYSTERILSSYIEGISPEGSEPLDLNEFIFCGEVYNVSVREGIGKPVLLTLKIPESESYCNYVEVVGFKHQAEVMKKAKPGDGFAAAGSVRTAKKDKKNVFNFVARDVCLLENH